MYVRVVVVLVVDGLVIGFFTLSSHFVVGLVLLILCSYICTGSRKAVSHPSKKDVHNDQNVFRDVKMVCTRLLCASSLYKSTRIWHITDTYTYE
jgi:hypothetical protein